MKALNGIKITLLGLLLASTSTVLAASSDNSKCMQPKNVLCQSIVNLNPYMDHDDAYELSNHFHQTALKYDVPAKVLVAIAYQESAFKQDTIRKISGFTYDEVFGYQEVKIGADFCMMQINIKNIRNMDLSIEQLLKDPKYCIEAGAKVLSMYKELYSKKDSMWWAYYNAVQKDKRALYHKLVTRHLDKIQKSQDRKVASAENETHAQDS